MVDLDTAQEVDEAMPGGGKDTLPAILANASGSGLSETGPDQPQDQGIRVGLGENLLTSADCTKTGLVVVRGGLKKLFVLSKGQRAVWWPRPMSGFSRMDVVTCTVVHKPAGQRRRRNQLNSKFSFCVRFSNKSKGTTNI